MTIDEAYQFVLFVANKEQRGAIPPAKFNILAPICQMSVLNDHLGNLKRYRPHDPIPEYAAHTNRKSREVLRPITQVAVSPTNIAAINASGDWSLPTGFLYALTVNDNITGIVCHEVTRDELFIMNKSQIKPPTASYPVYAMRSSFFTVSPISVSPRMEFIQKPTNPRWNFTEVSGEPVYSASGSVDFSLSEFAHLEICNKILLAIGVNLDSEKILAYAGMEITKGS